MTINEIKLVAILEKIISIPLSDYGLNNQFCLSSNLAEEARETIKEIRGAI